MCLVMTNPVDILAVRHVKQKLKQGGSVQDIFQITNYFFQTQTMNIITLFENSQGFDAAISILNHLSKSFAV